MRKFDPFFLENPAVPPSGPVNIEGFADCLLERARFLQVSPDAVVDELDRLVQYHTRNGCASEAVLALTLVLATIAEFGVITKQMPDGFERDHPALAFLSICERVDAAICPELLLQDMPVVPTFCDSGYFVGAGWYLVLRDLLEACTAANLFEYAIEVIGIVAGIFEKGTNYAHLAALYQTQIANYQKVTTMTSDIQRLLGKYYRIAFFGAIFGEDDGKMFVYRELKLSGLFDVTGRLEKAFKALYGEAKIEIINKAGLVNQGLLNPDKGFIQITAVNPFFEKSEVAMRQTVFELNTHLRAFSFDTPFVKGETRVQGSVEEQCLRRTILNVDGSIPAVTRRGFVPVSRIRVIEFDPIRVQKRAMKERLGVYEKAIQDKDMNALQPLLHGSLMTAVNEGPTKIAEVFLSGTTKTKQTEKLWEIFRRFLALNKAGLELMREHVKKTPVLAELFTELEAGMKILEGKLDPFLNPPKTT
jgi:hypothetical protein